MKRTKYDRRQLRITLFVFGGCAVVLAAFSIVGAAVLNKAFGSLYKAP